MRITRFDPRLRRQDVLDWVRQVTREHGHALEDFTIMAPTNPAHGRTVFLKGANIDNCLAILDTWKNLRHNSVQGEGYRAEPSTRGRNMPGYLWEFERP